jgi:hypothetical protein
MKKIIIALSLIMITVFSYSQTNVKISELPVATNLNTNIDFVGVQGGVTKKVSDSLFTRPYKVYTALVTQIDSVQTEVPLVIGNTYVIYELLGSDDFSNIGFVSLNVPFIATGTGPISWLNWTEVHNITHAEPTAIVLENALGTDVVYSYIGSGSYRMACVGFGTNTQKVFTTGHIDDTNEARIIDFSVSDEGSILLLTRHFTGGTFATKDGLLYQTPIEIRVYP